MANQAKITGPSMPDLMGNIGGAIKKGSVKTLGEASFKAKTIHLTYMARAVGGDMRMSNVGKNGAKLGINYKIGSAGEIPWASIAAKGPAQLIERPTRPHGIYPRGSRGVVRSNSRAKNRRMGPTMVNTSTGRKNMIMPPAQGFRRSAMHPGTKGKAPFAKGQEAAQGPTLRIMRKRTFNIIRAAAGQR